MYNELVGSKVNVVVSTRGESLLEYIGTLSKSSENEILLTDARISYLMVNFQKSIFGGNISNYKEHVEKVVINKKYIISCEQV